MKKKKIEVNIDIENEFKTKGHVDSFLAANKKDAKLLLGPHMKRFVYVDCPVCASKKMKREFVKEKFSYYICLVCDSLFVNPRPTKKMLNHFYKHSKSSIMSTQSLIDNESGRRKMVFLPRMRLIVDFLEKANKLKGRLLDVGCSVGTFLELIKNKTNFIVEGLEPDEIAYRVALKKGLKVYKTSLEDFLCTETHYDVIVSFEVMEHVFSPYNVLCKISSLLRKGGYFILASMNSHGLDMMFLWKHYKNVHAPCHLNFFNIDAVDILLNRVGFKVVKKMTPGFMDVSTIIKQIEKGRGPEIPPFFKYLLFNTNSNTLENFQGFIKHNCLSGHMLIFAQKV
ncbi:MAG: class I SAM-dependent methyltransferase [Candidatus Scalinduaceae bacterium]